jgi:hypothetical protein
MVTEEVRGSCMGGSLDTISYCLFLIHKFVRVHLIIPALEGAGWNFWLVVFGVCHFAGVNSYIFDRKTGLAGHSQLVQKNNRSKKK